MRRTFAVLALAASACTGSVGETQSPAQVGVRQIDAPPARFTTFESGQVRPLALSPNGKLLFAVNTPDDRLEIFRVRKGGLDHLSSLAVGMEPVAVAARSEDEVWVVNHLSDSVSVIAVGGGQNPSVVRTLQVGDEPRDIVFAGPNRSRAFITTAHRGQNSPVDPQLTTPGVGRADVFVFDATSASATPLTVLTLFADTPRALATSPDGNTVYAAAFLSGNQTTVVTKGAINDLGAGVSPGMPQPTVAGGIPQPPTGLVVKKQPDGTWRDAAGRDLSPFVRLNLPDRDVFAIDATQNPPAQVRSWSGVGTTLFGLAVNPVSGKIYVSNTEARNNVRFEGHGVALGGDPNDNDKTVRGHIAESRITVINGDAVTPRHLNKHINYHGAGSADERSKSLAFPTSLAVSSDGTRLYVAAFGSQKVGVFSTSALENDTFVPSAGSQVALSAGGPSGVVLDDRAGQLYVLTRFDDGISIVDTNSLRETAHLQLFNPEPAKVVNGRRFLYDATYTSAHGDSACASCHIFADFDALAWDLGDPDGAPKLIPGPYAIPVQAILSLLPFTAPVFAGFQTMKGPMTTQSLRGMDNHGAMHWRGDRNGGQFDAMGNPLPSLQPDGGSFSEQAAFKAFNVAFPGLVGRDAQLTDGEMQSFTDFILEVSYPPNPIRNLDNSLTPEQQVGHDFYFNNSNGVELPSDRFHNCNGCHILDPNGNAGVEHPGFFGTDGKYSFENESQIFKVPHLRNLYTKVGMFGMSPDPNNPITTVPEANPFMGDQVRGFGFQHDGAIDTVDHFLEGIVFLQSTQPVQNPGGPQFPPVPPNPFGIPNGPDGASLRHALQMFVFAFDSNLAPIVGQQVTLSSSNGSAVGARIGLLEARATAGECDLVARGRVQGRERGWLFQSGQFRPDTTGRPNLSDAQLRALAQSDVTLTFTCTPPGTGTRLALDRDGDGFADGDEIAAGTDPANPASHP